MAVEYIVNGSTALKASAQKKPAQLTLVPAQSRKRCGRIAGFVSGVEIYPHERTEVDAVLDDFQGTVFAKTAKDKLFCLAFGSFAFGALLVGTVLSSL